MGIVKAFAGAIGGTFADQWKEIITASNFDEHTAVAPGVVKRSNNGRGENYSGSVDVISNGSKIFVPENTAAFIFSQSGIEDIITEAGGYEYTEGEDSVFAGGNIKDSLFKQIKDRVGYGGQSQTQTQIAFVNLREIRDIKFGTKGALLYHDYHYEADLEVLSFGTFSLKITDTKKFIRNYVPPNTMYYSFDIKQAREQILSEFLQSFMVVLNSLSTEYRISQLPSQANTIVEKIVNDDANAGTWEDRFGFKLVKIGIQNIEFAPESRELVNQYSSNKMNLKAYDSVSTKASNIAAQQKIAEGIQENGLGDGGGMLFGMNMAQGLGSQAENKTTTMSIDDQIETLKKLKELVDAGIISEEEFELKKKEIL